jgi:alkanesulfonate monooxygenase SsuD/methylene tetrahydromethanopterin reductase-like flavin-dependent oxidoreductase (luciferase family)
VPKPLQKPHPPLFQPFAPSASSIRWCAAEGVTAVLPPMHAKHETRLSELYAAVSKRRLGDGVAFLRDIIIADSDEEADALWQNSSRFMATAWFEPFGFRRGMIDPDTGEYPSPQEMIDLGYALVGSVDTVCRRLEATLKRLPAEWIFFWAFNGLVPHAAMLRTIERWQTQVLPKLGLA